MKTDINPPVHLLNPVRIMVFHAWFLVFYLLFNLATPFIQSFEKTIDHNALNPWIQLFANETDGIELQVMLVSFPLYLLLGLQLANRINRHLSSAIYPFFWSTYFVGLTLIFGHHYWVSHSFFNADTLMVFTVLLLLTVAMLVFLNRITFSNSVKWLTGLSLFIFFVFIGFPINDPISLFDAGYLIGPANKIMQGERIGTFYMQYNLLLTLLFAAMQAFGLKLIGMKWVLLIIFSLWMLLYKKTASLLFDNRIFVSLFILALFLVRFLSITGGPVSLPQVSCLRLDLWVPLLWIFLRFGLNSQVTALGFSLTYLADDIFGLLYLVLFILVLVVQIVFNKKDSKEKLSWGNLIRLICLPAISIMIHLLVFGSVGSQAGKIYADLHIGFLPISTFSSFWVIAAFLPVAIYLLNHFLPDKSLLVLITGFVCIQLIYFFGRSHDHNLLNISGIFLFILFLSLDKLYTAYTQSKKVFYGSILILIGIGLNYSGNIKSKEILVKSKFKTGFYKEERDLENRIDQTGNYLQEHYSRKVMIISDYDAYLNYRLGYEQAGFFTPFFAHNYQNETQNFLISEIQKGNSLLVVPGSYQNLVEDLLQMNMENPIGHFEKQDLPQGLVEIRYIKK